MAKKTPESGVRRINQGHCWEQVVCRLNLGKPFFSLSVVSEISMDGCVTPVQLSLIEIEAVYSQ